MRVQATYDVYQIMHSPQIDKFYAYYIGDYKKNSILNFYVILKVFKMAILFFTEENHANIFINSNFYFNSD